MIKQRLEGMKNHTKLCHGDFNPSNVIITNNGKYHIIDWAHATQGNASADAARTYLLFAMQGREDLAEKYLDTFTLKSGIEKRNVQRWIPIVAGTQLTKEIKEETEFLTKWVDIVDFE
jgi:aminoglycoside phosphotransferase (APT) family kinase protein